MATKITYIRPSSDVSVGHSLQGLTTAAACMAEETADDDSTYITQSVTSTTASTVTTTINMSGTFSIGSARDFVVDKVTLCIRAKKTSSTSGIISGGAKSSGTAECTINGKTSSGSISIGNSYALSEISVDTSSFTTAGEYSFPVTISTTGAMGTGNKDTEYEIRVTQAYLKIEYRLFNNLTVIQGGTGTISGYTPTGLVETPITRTFSVLAADTTRFVKAYNGETDITSQFELGIDHYNLTDSDFTVTQTGTSENGFTRQSNLVYSSSMSGASELYGVTRFTLNLPAEITLNFSIVRPGDTGDYVYIGKVDTTLPTTSQPSSSQYYKQIQGSTSTTAVSYSMTIPSGSHYFDMMNYHGAVDSTRTARVTFSSPGYDLTAQDMRYTLPETEGDVTIRIIFSDYVETYIKDGNTWKRASKVFKKSNGVWVEQTPQTQSIIKPLFEENFVTEKL